MQQDSDIATLQAKILAFAAERDWQQFHDPKNLAMAVAVEAGELMDHFRWVRTPRPTAPSTTRRPARGSRKRRPT